MNLRLQLDTTGIEWDLVAAILKNVGMASYSGTLHERAFSNSHTVVFAFDDEKLIGFGRAISDGAYQAAIYDVAVLPDYQGKGLGKLIINQLISSCPDCNFILYAAPGKEQFYEKQNFSRMKTGMALFTNQPSMRQKGFTE
jgi:GNAT superfamily N-acetyltransferase